MNPEINRQQQDDVQRMKDALSRHANLRNLALEDLDAQKHLINGIKKVPQSKIVDQAQQLEHKILPQLLEKYNGDVNNETYQYWRGVLDSLNWLLHITDYAIRLEERVTRVKHNLIYYQQLAAKLERELDKFNTMESFLTSELITSYTQGK